MLYTQTAAAAAVIRRVQVILGQTIFVSGSFESNYSKEKKKENSGFQFPTTGILGKCRFYESRKIILL